MADFTLKYGQGELQLSQSKTLIGVRPKRNREADANIAVGMALQGADWTDQGALGGFRIVAIDDARVDADAALDRVRMDGAVAAGTHVFELPQGKGLYVPTGDVYVEFKSGSSENARQAAIDKFSLSIKEARGVDGFVFAVTPDSPNPIKVAAGLQQDPIVDIAEPDLASRAAVKAPLLPMDSLLGEQWHLQNTGRHRGTTQGFLKGADARVVEAWSAAGTLGQPDVVIAVIDDGFDLKHPDFSMPGKVVHKWDFTRKSDDPRPEAGDWHGTACAGVALAAAGGGGVVGAAPGCTLMPVRWGPDLSDAQLEAWFKHVTTKGAWVVSCSWGALNPFFPLSTRASRAIAKCAREGRGGRGCVVVFAAGNENSDTNDPAAGTVSGFANHPDVIAVAASNSRDQRSNYSNFGAAISVCAPSSGAGGWGVLTSDVTGMAGAGAFLGYADGDYTYDFGGTSSACPLVAGIAALVLSVKPNLSAAEVKRLLQGSARKIGPPSSYKNGHSRQFGHGCVNALAAVLKVLPQAQPVVAALSAAAQGNASPAQAKAKAAPAKAKPARVKAMT